jgi:hypothetical protein
MSSTDTTGGFQSLATPGLAITPEWQMWLAENLLRGVTGENIVKKMVTDGFDEPTAVREVNAAAQSPYLNAAVRVGVGPVGAAAAAAAPQSAGTQADKYAWFLEVARRNARLSSSYGTVPRVHKPSREEFLENFYSQNKPCIIEGAIDDWPALTKWTGDYLKEKCGDAIVEVQANRNSDAEYELNSDKLKKDMTFGEFVDIAESGEETNDFYMTANNSGKNKAALRSLWEDIRFPEYLDGSAENDGFFWYGPAGIVTPIHHDLTNNFMAQVRGRKLVRIIAPFESADVYNNRHCFSPVDIMNPDLEKFPKMADVTIIDVEIGPGDLFFLPVGWWHGVRGLDISLTMTFTNFVYENDFFSFYTTNDEIS